MTKFGVDAEVVWFKEEATADELFSLLDTLALIFGKATICTLASDRPMGIARILGKGPEWVGIGIDLHKLYVAQVKERYGVDPDERPIGADN